MLREVQVADGDPTAGTTSDNSDLASGDDADVDAELR